MAGHIKAFLFMSIFLREQFFRQALFQTYFLLGSEITTFQSVRLSTILKRYISISSEILELIIIAQS